MPKYLHFAIAIFIIAPLASCSRDGFCEGFIVLTNPISDVTVAVGDTVFIDLANPPVFKSSERNLTYSFRALTGSVHFDLNRNANPNDSGKFSLLLVVGESQGEALAELIATSGCLENETTFKVTVQ